MSAPRTRGGAKVENLAARQDRRYRSRAKQEGLGAIRLAKRGTVAC